MAQSDARFGYKAKMSREEHDLSRPFGFTTCPGMLCPIFADFASPGDTYYIKHDLEFLRTQPMASPAMVDVKVHYESFFVPVQMIYAPFEQTYFAITNAQTSLIDPALLNNASFPLLNQQAYYFRMQKAGSASEYHQKAFRFADFMDMNPYGFAVNNFSDTSTSSNPYDYTGATYMRGWFNVFPWQTLAYHTIFNYFYRLDDKSQFSNLNCNWDRYYSQTTPVVMDYNSNFFTIYQRPWDFDYFTSIYRSPIVSAYNVQTIMPSQTYSDLVDRGTMPIKSDGNAPVNPSQYSAFSTDYNQAGAATSQRVVMQSATAMIRQAFANEKLAMITGRTRKNYDSQVLAHFGVNVPHDPKHEISLIGHDTYMLQVGEVTSLASTSDAPLGELAGKGWSRGDGRQHKFTAPCHGVIMTIFSVEPLRRYVGGFARQNIVSSAFDFPIPEYDRLGNQPMFRCETGYVEQSSSSFEFDIVGWKERYYAWKRRPAKISAAFLRVPSGVSGANLWESYFIGGFAFSRRTTGYPYPELERSFYIDANCMDGLMLVDYDFGWLHVVDGENWDLNPHLVYQRDPFIVNSHEKVKKISWMSKDGEPIYPW